MCLFRESVRDTTCGCAASGDQGKNEGKEFALGIVIGFDGDPVAGLDLTRLASPGSGCAGSCVF